MPFRHFHKHSQKYLIFSTSAIVFSLVVFTIPQALAAFTGSAVAGGGEYVRFQTLAGEKVAISYENWARSSQQIRGFAQINPGYLAPATLSDAPLAHAILLREADDLGIEAPPEVVDKYVNTFYQQYASTLPPGQALTRRMMDGVLSQFGLDSNSFRVLAGEMLRITLYRETIEGMPIHNPEQVVTQFVAQNELVSYEYVPFRFADYREQLRANLPPDEELSAYYDDLDDAPDFMTDVTYTIDLATIDADGSYEWTEGQLALYTDPLDDLIVQRYRNDSTRYGEAEGEIATIDDVPEEARAKIVADAKLQSVLTKFSRDYYEAKREIEAELDAEAAGAGTDESAGEDAGSDDSEGTEPGGGDALQDEGDDEADEASADEPTAEELAEAERAAKLAERLAAKFGDMATGMNFTLVRHEGLSEKELQELDPPNAQDLDIRVRFLQPNDMQTTQASRDRKYSYAVRVVEKVDAERKDFTDVREDIIERWLDDNAKDKAVEAAEAFRATIRDEVAARPEVAPLLTGIHAERDERLAEFDAEEVDNPDDPMTIERREGDRERLEATYWLYSLSAIESVTTAGPDGAPQPARLEERAFRRLAEEAGYTLEKMGPFRRNASTRPYFRDLHEGDEEYLMDQNLPLVEKLSFGDRPRLASCALGTVSAVLVDERFVDDATEAAFVVLVSERTAPNPADMTPRDREDARTRNINQLQMRAQLPQFSIWSMDKLNERHQPELLVTPSDEDQ